MKVRKITEGQLRSIINECVQHILNEGYSAKAHQNEIVAIAKEAYETLIANQGRIYTKEWEIPAEGNSMYVYNISISFGRKENAYANRQGIIVTITPQTTVNTIAKLLMHEMTHIYDVIGYKKTGYNDTDLYRNIGSVSYYAPEGVKDIIYHLWIPTEFNALQTTHDFNDENFDAMLERLMGYLQEMYDIPTVSGHRYDEDYEGIWKSIRNAIGNHIPDRYRKCTLDKFKKYFITHSMDLLKKLVKKWDGEQNTHFV